MATVVALGLEVEFPAAVGSVLFMEATCWREEEEEGWRDEDYVTKLLLVVIVVVCFFFFRYTYYKSPDLFNTIQINYQSFTPRNLPEQNCHLAH